jgi:lysophospholipase L1-like esterase
VDVGSGWVALLGKRLYRQKYDYQVVNASISGDTTANGLARLPKLLAAHQPAIVIIELGGNDGLRGLALDQMKHNITAMVTKAKARHARVLVGMRLPPTMAITYGKVPAHLPGSRPNSRWVWRCFSTALPPTLRSCSRTESMPTRKRSRRCWRMSGRITPLL